MAPAQERVARLRAEAANNVDERVLDPTGDFDRHSTDEILGARTILNRDRQPKFSTWAK